MADLDELYRRVDICERLLHTLSVIPEEGRHIPFEGGRVRHNICSGGIIKFERVVFPYQTEAFVSYKGIDYSLNYGFIKKASFPYEEKWINISKNDLSFLNKTIIPLTDAKLFQRSDRDAHGENLGVVPDDIFVREFRKGLIPPNIKIDLWNEMLSQLIPSPLDAVESITRETINEALFETRLQIHEIKKHPPYSMGAGNPSLRMNLFMPTVSPPVSPHYAMGNPSLTPRSNQSTPPVSPRNHTRRPVPRFSRRKTQNVKNNTPFIGLAPRRF